MLNHGKVVHLGLVTLCLALLGFIFSDSSNPALETTWLQAQALFHLDLRQASLDMARQVSRPVLEDTGVDLALARALSASDAALAELSAFAERRLLALPGDGAALQGLHEELLRWAAGQRLGPFAKRGEVMKAETRCLDLAAELPDEVGARLRFLYGNYPDVYTADPLALGQTLATCLQDKVKGRLLASPDEAVLASFRVTPSRSCARELKQKASFLFFSKRGAGESFTCPATLSLARVQVDRLVRDSELVQKLKASDASKPGFVREFPGEEGAPPLVLIFPALVGLDEAHQKLSPYGLLASLHREREEARAARDKERQELLKIPVIDVRFANAMLFFPLVAFFLMWYLVAGLYGAARWLDATREPEWILFKEGWPATWLGYGSLCLPLLVYLALLYQSMDWRPLFIALLVALVAATVVLFAFVGKARKDCLPKKKTAGETAGETAEKTVHTP